MNQRATRPSGSHAISMPMPRVATTNSMQSPTQRNPNQNVRICQRKCDSSHVPRTSLRFT
jgi:hypothetical protein